MQNQDFDDAFVALLGPFREVCPPYFAPVATPVGHFPSPVGQLIEGGEDIIHFVRSCVAFHRSAENTNRHCSGIGYKADGVRRVDIGFPLVTVVGVRRSQRGY